MNRVLRIGTRGSDLALWQSRHVAQLLHQRNGTQSELVIVQTSGDVDRSRALHELPGTGFFTKELQRALLEGKADIAVHSLKDLPTDEPAGLAVVAVTAREDARELLLAAAGARGDGALGLKSGAVLGTSSLRRAAQALAHQPDLTVKPLRGNVPTRVRKLREGIYDAILLAAAGVDRLALDMSGLIATRLELDFFLPSPGQGALAIEARGDDHAARDAVRALHDESVDQATACERAVLKGLGGGCHLPLGAYCGARDGGFQLTAALGELDEGVTRASVRHARAFALAAPDAAKAVLAALLSGSRS